MNSFANDLLQLFQSFFQQYSSDCKLITLAEFESFLYNQQAEPRADPLLVSQEHLIRFMRGFVQDPRRDVDPPFFTVKEVNNPRIFI